MSAQSPSPKADLASKQSPDLFFPMASLVDAPPLLRQLLNKSQEPSLASL